ncbi:hypothetical protein DPV78_010850 [Talaromyces pinophilus]|nr:hypothetical protein DPV78_010850 [Talaromyces pinophilus]
MPLNISALAPGPAGTTMLGERGGIEAAAQRGLERQQREREDAAARDVKVMNDTMSASGTTLCSENMKSDGSERNVDLVKPSSGLDSKKAHEDASSHTNKPHQGDDGSSQKHSEGKWERFKKHFQ